MDDENQSRRQRQENTMRNVTEQPTPEEQPSYTLKTKDLLSVMHIVLKSNSGLQTHANATVASMEAQ